MAKKVHAKASQAEKDRLTDWFTQARLGVLQGLSDAERQIQRLPPGPEETRVMTVKGNLRIQLATLTHLEEGFFIHKTMKLEPPSTQDILNTQALAAKLAAEITRAKVTTAVLTAMSNFADMIKKVGP